MSVIFSGLNCSPVGNATLNVVAGQLVVGNIGTNGMDGVLIEIPKGKDYIIEHDRYDFKSNGLLSIATLAQNENNVTFISSTKYIRKDDSTNKILWGFDFSNIAPEFSSIGYKNGTQIFSNPHNNPTGPPNPSDPAPVPLNWVIVGAIAAVISAGVAVYNLLDSSETKYVYHAEFYPDGKVKSFTATHTEDPTPIDVECDGNTYNVDTWGIKYEQTFQNSDNVLLPEKVGVLLLGNNVNDIKINNILTPNITII